MYKTSKRLHAVVIGRFQPLHLGHKKLIEKALDYGQKVCIVLGSARSAPDLKNPFTPALREEMIKGCFPQEIRDRLRFVSVRDYTYNLNMWLTDVRNKVLDALECEDRDITLFGHHKDESSFYLKMFPNWAFEETHNFYPELDATKVRETFLNGGLVDAALLANMVPTNVLAHLSSYMTTNTYKNLCEEFKYNKQYIEDHKFKKDVPYDPVFLTTDAVVIQSGHVLVVKRKFNPGKGLLALPGGFLQKGKTLEDSMLSELKEETGMVLPMPIIRASIVESRPFDSPSRSTRGRTVTQAFLIKLQDDLEYGLPKVKGSDDAEKAFWLPLADLDIREDEFFEDHAHIIRYFHNRI